MFRKYLAVSALTGLVACSGGEFLFDENAGGGGTTPPPGTPIVNPDAVNVPANLAKNLRSITLNPNGQSITVEVASLDTTPLRAVYSRRPTMDVDGYTAYAVQEDALDRLFVALVAESADDSVQAGVVSDGGQFQTYFSGGFFRRNGAYSKPTIGTGPGAGQVSYAGAYAGLVNGGGDGLELLPVTTPVDPVLLPGQPARISGIVFLNANFADNAVNGAVYDRVVVDSGLRLDSIILLPTAIAANGTFSGSVEPERQVTGGVSGAPVGSGAYGGIFGGTGASSVGGVVALTEFSNLLDDEQEVGVFVLTQCGLPGDAPICGNVAP